MVEISIASPRQQTANGDFRIRLLLLRMCLIYKRDHLLRFAKA